MGIQCHIDCLRLLLFCKPCIDDILILKLVVYCRNLKKEVNNERDQTTALRKALQECKACNIKRPECGDNPPPCFPRVECRDTYDGPVCGPCPTGFKASQFRGVDMRG